MTNPSEMSGVDPAVVASLAAKLDALDLDDAERLVLTDLLAEVYGDDAEVEAVRDEVARG